MHEQYPVTHPMQHAQFRAWLLTLPPETPFAQARDCHACPLFAWLQAHGIAVTKVQRDLVWTRTKVYNLPAWACRFILLLDEFQTPLNVPEVTPALALRALDAAVLQTEGSACHA